MTDKEKLDAIRAEIHRLVDVRGYDREMANDLFAFMDSLPNEPISEELEEASEKCIKELIPEAELNSATPFALEYVVKLLHETFRASAKWQKEQLMKQAIDVQVNPLLGETFVGCKVSGYEVGEKVKIIIIKEGEKC